MVLPLLFPALVSAQLVLVADNSVPKLNVEPGCRAAADTGVGPGRNANACQEDEYKARDQLAKDWTSFPASDRDRCMRLAALGGQPSYVELLTCLEMARDVAKDAKAEQDQNAGLPGVGSASTPARSRKMK
ncbi:MAG TPA: hypothetical protein VFB45_21530 [Pseudolabrys sp.]|nr:hypothetical protein [Pseudolabrys sp.]